MLVTYGRSVFFFSGTPVSYTNKTDRHDITELLLKVALNTITITWTHLINITRENFVLKSIPPSPFSPSNDEVLKRKYNKLIKNMYLQAKFICLSISWTNIHINDRNFMKGVRHLFTSCHFVSYLHLYK